MVVKVVLPNDRYVRADLEGSQWTKNAIVYQRTIAADCMRLWMPVGSISDLEDDVAVHRPRDKV